MLTDSITLCARPASERHQQQNGRFSDAHERAGLSLPEPPEKPLRKSTPGCILPLIVSWRRCAGAAARLRPGLEARRITGGSAAA